MIEFLVIKVVLAGIVIFVVLNLAGFQTWVERKQSALIQDRIGANRAPIFGFRLLGLFHGLADVIKMFTKEDIVPAGADKTLHALAPFFSVFFALVIFAAIPFGDSLDVRDIPFGDHLNLADPIRSPRSTRQCSTSLPCSRWECMA